MHEKNICPWFAYEPTSLTRNEKRLSDGDEPIQPRLNTACAARRMSYDYACLKMEDIVLGRLNHAITAAHALQVDQGSLYTHADAVAHLERLNSS